MDIAEHLGELLIDRMPEVSQQFLRLQRSLLENTFAEFVKIFFSSKEFLIHSLFNSVVILKST